MNEEVGVARDGVRPASAMLPPSSPSNAPWPLYNHGHRVPYTTYVEDKGDTEDSSSRKMLASILYLIPNMWNFLKTLYESTPFPWLHIMLIVLWATIVSVANDEELFDAGISLAWQAGSTIATILSFLIVFRTNQSYQRWYDGLVLWGNLTHSCIEMTQQAAGWIDSPELARRIMSHAIAFAYTAKQHLRGEVLDQVMLEGILKPVEVERMNSLNIYVPFYCADCIRECIKKGLKEHPQPWGQQSVARGLDTSVMNMTRAFNGMVRIKSTEQPEAYKNLLHFFTVFYLLLLPVLSEPLISYIVIPEAFFTSYLMLGLQLVAADLEQPFGYDPSDLKLDGFWRVIRKQCLAAFYVGCKGDNNLTLDDGGAQAAKDKYAALAPTPGLSSESVNSMASPDDKMPADLLGEAQPRMRRANTKMLKNGDMVPIFH